jgi:hypothetical protein
MTDTERQALQHEHAACMARASAIAAQLVEAAAAKPIIARDDFVSLKTAAAAWGITDDAARKKAKRLSRDRPEWATKRGAGRWIVHRQALA